MAFVGAVDAVEQSFKTLLLIMGDVCSASLLSNPPSSVPGRAATNGNAPGSVPPRLFTGENPMQEFATAYKNLQFQCDQLDILLAALRRKLISHSDQGIKDEALVADPTEAALHTQDELVTGGEEPGSTLDLDSVDAFGDVIDLDGAADDEPAPAPAPIVLDSSAPKQEPKKEQPENLAVKQPATEGMEPQMPPEDSLFEQGGDSGQMPLEDLFNDFAFDLMNQQAEWPSDLMQD